MKILMVNKFLYFNGGSETYMIKLGEYLKSMGHDVQYFGMYDEKNIVGNAANAYVPNIDYHKKSNTIKKIKMGVETIYSKRARKEIRKVLAEFRPDICHLNNINFQLTPAIIYEIKKFKIPLIQTVHDVQIACPCHRFYIEHTEQICEQCNMGKFYKCMKNKCVQGSRLKSLIAASESYYYHFRNTYNLVDLYICPSRFIRDKIYKAGVDKERIRVIYNFTDKIKPVDMKKESEKYALYFGRFSKEKGILSLLDVCKEMPNVKLVVAGRGPLEKEVKSLTSNMPNVEYVGFKTGEALKELISGAAFSIYPSEWYENCPLSVIESQALGTPVIGSDLGGTKELISHGKTGLVFKGCNISALRNSIEELWDNDSLIDQMSSNSIKITQMNIEDYAEYILRLYETLRERKVN